MNVRVAVRHADGTKNIVDISKVDSVEEGRAFAMKEMKAVSAVAVEIPGKLEVVK